MLFLGALTILFFASYTGGVEPSADPSILIIGGGVSGIAAATRLLKDGFTNIQILEAENRIGGRIYSFKFGEAYVDIGAQHCHGEENNIVYALAKDLNVLRHYKNNSDARHFYLSNGDEVKKTTKEKIFRFIDMFLSYDIIPGCENLTSVGDCLDVKFKFLVDSGHDEIEKETLSNSMDMIKSFISDDSGSLNLHDLKSTTEYQVTEGDQLLNWNGHGYKTILDILMQKFPDPAKQLPIDDRILLAHKVANICWQDGKKIKIVTENNNLFEADHVIFTSSLGVLKASHQHMFQPNLGEEKIEAIKNIGYGSILKGILFFSEHWWGESILWTCIWTKEDRKKLTEMDLEWLTDLGAFSQAENNPNVLIAWFAGEFLSYIEIVPEEKFIYGIKYLINKFLPTHFNVTMPDKIIRTRWYSNPNFKGTYSYETADGGKDLPEKLGKPLEDKDGKPLVLFAGEATHPFHFSTVHGAIETGYREADRLKEFYKNKK